MVPIFKVIPQPLMIEIISTRTLDEVQCEEQQREEIKNFLRQILDLPDGRSALDRVEELLRGQEDIAERQSDP
jgi:hypothetical protein